MRKNGKPNLDFLNDCELTPDYEKLRGYKEVASDQETPGSIEFNGSLFTPVPGLEGVYASKDGEIARSTRSGALAILTPYLSTSGYPIITFAKKRYPVHRLILETFVSPKPEDMVCRHLNDVKTDNRLGNLAWGTQSENMKDARKNLLVKTGKNTYNKLNPEIVRSIRSDHKQGASQRSLREKYGITNANLIQILNRITWRYVS